MNYIDKFWSKVIIPSDPDECWDWKGKATTFHIDRGYSIGRASWIVHNNGVMPRDWELVLHRCDNKRCGNPRHLYLGTQQDNMNDAYNRNRMHRKGKLLKRKQVAKKDLHESYNVSLGKTVEMERRGKRYIVSHRSDNRCVWIMKFSSEEDARKEFMSWR